MLGTARIVSFIYVLVRKWDGIALLVIGALDSSFLFIPFGNDLLLVGLTANHPRRMPYYAAMSTAGSVLGCSILDWISRKAGEKGLQQMLARQLIDRKDYIRRHIAWSLILASVMPPPFPFTAIVAAAAALQYPRKKLLTIVAAARFFRFSMVGLTAIMFGKSIIQAAYSPTTRWIVVSLCVISIAGSIVTAYARIKGISLRLTKPSSQMLSNGGRPETHLA
jgi:membrane protein YqaA with SNARE-associated domain